MRTILPNFLLLVLLFTLPFAAFGQCTDADTGEIDINPPIPADGSNYPGGTVVEMCYTLNEFNTPSINWLHSVIPTFGPGFDINSFTVTSLPTSCAGTGNWGYFPSWTSCASGLMWGPGFAFDGSQNVGCGGAGIDGDPGNNWGDGGALCANRTWCWELTTVPVSPFSCQLINYNTTIFVYGDAETGNWSPGGNPPCLEDDPVCEPGLVNLQIEQDPSPCGCTTVNAVWDNQVLGQQCGLNIMWTGPGGFTSNELNPEVCQSGTYMLDISINNCAAEMASFNVFITGTNPVVTATAAPSQVCAGDDITFTASDAGPGATYSWNIDGTIYSGQTVTVTATGSGAENAIVTATNAQGCESEPFTVFYVVLPIPNTDFTVDPSSLCTGETTIVNGNTGPGDESWDFGGATVLSGSGNGPYELSFPAAGTYTIVYEKENTVCAGADSVEIEVFETPTETMVECSVSADDSITFNWDGIDGALEYEISLDGGMPFTVTDTFYGAGGLANGATVTLTVIPVGNAICPLPPSASATCTVFSCPVATLTIDQVAQDFCLTGSNPPLDLTFSGSGFGTLTDTSWTGPGVFGMAFFPDSAGLGTHTITLTITNDLGCTYTDNVDFTVLPLPTADFTVTDTICSTATSLVTYTGNADPGTSTFNWDFAGATIVSGTGAGPYDLSWPLAGSYVITFTVEDDQNCISTEFDQTVTVIEPLPVPSPGCGVGGLDSVSFNWLDIAGATGYVISIDGGTPDTITGTTLGVGGLNEGDAVMLTIFALGDAPCGNSTDTTITCVAEACPDLTLEIDEDPSGFCVDQDPNFIVLEIAQNSGSGNGTYAWSGPGVSNDTFYIGAAGLGMHEISVTYSEGLCDYDDVATFTVFDTPQSAFSLSDTTVCEGQSITVTNEVAMFPAADYQWDFTGGTPVSASGIGPHVVTYATAGTYTITQTVTSNGCSTSSTIEVTVVAPLTAPVVSCDPAQELEEITFNWTAVDPNVGYEVTVDGVVVDTVNTLDYTVIGLSPDTSVMLSVRALGNGVCGDGPASVAQTCFTASCPIITLTPTIPQSDFCLGGNDDPVILSSTSAGGDMTGVFSWSGPGVVAVGPDFVFDPVAAGLGTHVLVVNYVETAGCSATDSLTVNVFDVPTANFTISDTLICLNETTIITYTGSATVGVATFDWDFGPATVTDLGGEVYELSYPSGGVFTISLTVTQNGCVSEEVSDEVAVAEELLATTITCTNQTLTSVTFEWTPVIGATAYQVEYNGSTDTITGLSQLIGGLEPGEDVTITVTPLGPEPCGNGPASSENCEADSCPAITITPSAGQTSFCLNGNPGTTVLSATSSGGDMTGTFVWSGPGVSLVGTDYIFDPVVTGSGDFTLTVEYEETAGCDGTATLTMNVFDVPTANFTIAPDTICTDRTTVVTYVGTATLDADFDWDFDGATVTDLGNETYELNWPTAGTYTVSLTVSEAGCTGTFSADVEAYEPLATPEPECIAATFTSITFGWAAISGANGYQLSIDGGAPFVIDSTTYFIGGLDDAESITITIIALGDEPCGNSELATVSCSTDTCPDVTLTPTAAQNAFCAEGGDDATLLNAGLSGSTGGEISWSGTGIEQDIDGNYLFNPTGLIAGVYPLTVTYTESICTYSATIDLTVNAVPNSVITATTDNFCTTTTTTVSFAGTAAAEAVFDWDFDGATVTDLGNESYELNWNQSGNYQVALTVEQNGCSHAASFDLSVTTPPVAGVQNLPAAVCENGGDLVEMSDLITGASAGGVWTPNAGAPAAAVDPATGRLNTSMLTAGSYEYLYTVDGGVCDDAVTSVFVTIEPAPIADAGQEQLLTCTMGMVSLNGSGSSGNGNLTYLWTGPDGLPVPTDPTSPMIDVAIPGTYTLTVTSEIGCSSSSEVTVDAETEVPVPQIELSNISCFGSTDGTILVESVDGGRPPYNYALNGTDFGTTNFFTGLDQGEYSVRVTDANGCFTELFLGLTRPDQLSVSVELPNGETIYEEGELVTMTANINGGNAIDTLIWEPDTLNSVGEGFSNVITFPADESRTIGVTVIDENGCMATDQTNIIVRKERNVYFPTGFSPNGDNVNDILFIGANEEKVELIQEFQVFNRWGESVFENYDFLPNEPAQGWDGNHRGEPLNPQVLVYYAKVLFQNGDEVLYKGDITLIR
ncbi:hypothetical protein CEQ90_10770 [Lewinellaceae bacterium SD302]|nr:hypothetical protein CEQ90_10770 [Lewinellaceae bacterium SD302]